jgi:hypothetical protein
MHVYWNILTMHGPINVKYPNNISKWQIEFNLAFKGLIEQIRICRQGIKMSASSLSYLSYIFFPLLGMKLTDNNALLPCLDRSLFELSTYLTGNTARLHYKYQRVKMSKSSYTLSAFCFILIKNKCPKYEIF